MTLSPSDSPDGPQETTTLTTAERSRLLGAERRRTVLDIVEDRSPPLDLGTLATAVGAVELDDVEPDPATIERISITLHHNHLPRLADAGVLDYDPTSNHVTAVGDLPNR